MLLLAVPLAPPADAFGSSEPPPIPAVNAGGYMTCGIQADQTAACWGDNVAADPTGVNLGAATPPADTRFLVVNAGYATACGITTDHAVVCWGNNNFGKVTLAPAGEFSHVAPGFNFVCALRKADGAPVCWGADDAGQVSGTPSGETFSQLTVGIRHACGLRPLPDGGIVCWGDDRYGQLKVPDGAYRAVNSGNFTVCAIRSDKKTDGTVECWGRNQGGQHTVPEKDLSQVSAGFAHVCGLRPNGTLLCWGRNSEGQADAPLGTYTNVSAGTFHSCAMPTAGPPAVCWGNNAAGRVQPDMRSTAPPSAAVGVPYAFPFTMATHVAPAPGFAVTGGSLPPGLELGADGLLTGTPTTAGTYEFTVSATNGLSPPDCVLAAATGSLPCTPGGNGPSTATRTFTIVVEPLLAGLS